ncbi:MAG: S-layer homology domain-containing protein [Acidimicrobiia bacterium]|nr:S-layer homology domain-containing protein [Acidimicrobiia bacterium]MDH5420997.1 S-layer homology domain-containing protein [Acidimicrobiia bacterium]MDH5504316.1 S-layer homology domain-containing protein [Acidimicrobiia bacterium]
MSRRVALLMVLIAALVLPATPALAEHIPPNGYFTDDDGTVHEANINALRAAGITTGCNPPDNTRFCPFNNVTRAEMATFLVRALDLPSTSADYFDDDNGNIHESAINSLRASGITTGCRPSGDRYCPDQAVTRGQMAAFLVRGFQLAGSATNSFTDDNGSPFEGDIDALAAAGITAGCAPERFCPTRTVTRGEMATFLTRAVPLPIPLLHDRLLFSIPFSGVCDPLQVTCQITINSPRLDEYYINEGWFYEGPYAPGDDDRFADATFTVTMNNVPVDLAVGNDITSGSTIRRSYTAKLGKLEPGTYVFTGIWRWNGQVLYKTTVTLKISA